jgi:hypothetical protein
VQAEEVQVEEVVLEEQHEEVVQEVDAAPEALEESE